MSTATLCGCGCGAEAKPGNRFLHGHAARLQKKTAGPRPPQATQECPRCGQTVVLRRDGTLGRHFTHARKTDRQRCVAGEIGVTPSRTGRRVSIRFDVVIPSEWTNGEYRQTLRDLLLGHADAGFVVDIAVTDREDAS